MRGESSDERAAARDIEPDGEGLKSDANEVRDWMVGAHKTSTIPSRSVARTCAPGGMTRKSAGSHGPLMR